MLNAMRSASVPERIDRAQLARELLAHKVQRRNWAAKPAAPLPKIVIIVSPDLADGGADVLRVDHDRAVVLKRQTYGAKLRSLLAGSFNYVASHSALPHTIHCPPP